MLPYIPKQEVGKDPESIITTKSMIAAIIICFLAGFCLPVLPRMIAVIKSGSYKVQGLLIENQSSFRLPFSNGNAYFSIVANKLSWEIVCNIESNTKQIELGDGISIFNNGRPVKMTFYGYKSKSGLLTLNGQHISWRCERFGIKNNDNIQLVLDYNLFPGSQFESCQLSYSR